MDYRELLFYQKAREVIKGVNTEIKKWPNMMQAQVMSRQLFRAATSVGANIAEGHGRHEGLEYIHFLRIAQASANEVDHWLNTALDCEIGSPPQIKHLIQFNNETRKMLTKTIYTLSNQKNLRSLSEAPTPYSLIPYSPEEDEILP